jgi:hypothetical protein
MTKLEVFTTLADCVTELERHVWNLPHSGTRLALEALVIRFDGLVDNVFTMTQEQEESNHEVPR